MATNEEGEFELVLGNKQLLSVFFLVVLLLGVFFSMGYIVGRNTAPVNTQVAGIKQPPIVVGAEPLPPAGSSSAVTSALPDPTKPSPSALKSELPPPSSSRPEPVKSTAEPVKTAKVEPPPAPKPEPVKTAVATPKPEPVKAAPAPKPEPVKTAATPKPEPAKPPVSAAASGGGSPSKGSTYLQVAATKPSEASLMIGVLNKKGFPTTTSPVPDSPLVRVLVGPVSSGSVGSTRDALNAAGFKPIVRKF